MSNKIQSNYPTWSFTNIQPQNQLITYRTAPSQGDDPITWQELDNNFEILRYTINSVIDDVSALSFDSLESRITALEGIEGIDAYTKVESDAKYALASDIIDSYTKTESDGRYQPVGSYALASDITPHVDAYTKTESDSRYQAAGNYALASDITPHVDAYTKTESDGKYALASDITPHIDAYTKVESDSRYLSSSTTFSLDSLSDVDVATNHSPTDGQALVWNESMSHWMPGTVSGGSGNFVLGDQIHYVANMPIGRFEVQKGPSHPYYRATAPIWSSGTSYSSGDIVKVLDTRSTISGTHYLYYKAEVDNPTSTPGADTQWSWTTTSYVPFYGEAGWPWNFAGTRAATVVQVHDDQDIDNYAMQPGAVFDFEVSGNGFVDTSTIDFSGSIHWGVQSSTRKYHNGSAQCFTAVGGLHEIEPGGYNEVGLFQGECANLGSAYGTMSGVEVRCKDSDKDGYGNKTVSFDTKMNAVIGRIMREHNGERDVNCFVASSEGTVPVDAMITAYTSPNTGGGLGGGVFKEGIDISNANLTTGGAVIIHEGDQIKGSDDNGTRYSVMKMGTDKQNPLEVWVSGGWKKVEIGPEDSGGTGYRALRVLN